MRQARDTLWWVSSGGTGLRLKRSPAGRISHNCTGWDRFRYPLPLRRRQPGDRILHGVTATRPLASITIAIVTALFCSSAIAETSEERSACIGDAFSVCWSAIPNRDDVFHCLLDNRNRLSVACRTVMDQYRRPRHRIVRSRRQAAHTTRVD